MRPRHMLGVIGLVVLFAAGCTDDGDDDAARRATTTTARAAGTSGGEGGSGEACAESERPDVSPATYGGDGMYAVYIDTFDREARRLTFDLAQWLSGDAAARAWRDAHPDDPDGAGDYMILNKNAKLRTLPVAVDATYEAVFGDDDLIRNIEGETVDAAEFERRLLSRVRKVPTWLAVRGDRITAVCEQYTP